VKRLQRVLSVGLVAAIGVTLASCASSDRDSSSSTSGSPGGATPPAGASDGSTAAGEGSDTMIFGSEGAPKMFDALYATDGATFKVTRQMTEGLVQYKPGTADLEPALAESWESSADGLTWTFKIRQGVKFHDGTALDAAAVCYNLDRMYEQASEAGQTLAQYWADNFDAFKDQKNEDGTPKKSLYAGCEATDPSTAVVKVSRVTSKFPNILGLPSFAIQSPEALKKYDANNVTGTVDAYTYPAYALEHPTGTGPFKFAKYDTANGTVELVRNDDYWGEKAKLATLIFKIIPDESARKQELEAGTIDGYDLPSPGDWDALKQAGFNVAVRPAFNILYLGLNPKNNPALKDLKVRQAVAYAVNRPELVSSQLAEGATPAINFYPESVDGWTDQVEQYAYDPEKAKSLLAEAGQSNLTLNFYWPTEVSRPYMPSPKDIYQALSSDLQAVGITVVEHSISWQPYLDAIDDQQADAFIVGWTGDYNTPDNFLGSFFSRPTERFGTQYYEWGQKLSDDLAAADSEPDAATRTGMYEELNKQIAAEYVPGVPLAHNPAAIVVASNVQGLVPSPLTDERFVSVSKS